MANFSTRAKQDMGDFRAISFDIGVNLTTTSVMMMF
jgi:hypothetical protein